MSVWSLLARAARLPFFPHRLPVLGHVFVTHDWAMAALADPRVQVPYGSRSQGALDLDFVLGITDVARHGTARALVGSVLHDARAHAAAADGLDRAEAVAMAALAVGGDAPFEIDAVQTLVEPAVRAWATCWLGLPDDLAGDTVHVSRCVMHRVFANPVFPGGRSNARAAAAAGDAVRAYRGRLMPIIAAARRDAAPGGGVGGAGAGMLPALVERLADDKAVADNVLGLTVGPCALMTVALTQALAALLSDHADACELALALARRATEPGGGHAGDAAAARTSLGLLFLELARLHPPAPLVTREVTQPVVVRNGGERPRRVQGRVSVLTQSAMLDRDAFDAPRACDPERFRRLAAPHLSFGGGMHACMGMQVYAELAARIFAPLLAAGSVTSDGRIGKAAPPPGIRRGWNAPKSLRVRITPSA